jgi:hypothetical protein
MLIPWSIVDEKKKRKRPGDWASAISLKRDAIDMMVGEWSNPKGRVQM